jgi:hypothetical protein
MESKEVIRYVKQEIPKIIESDVELQGKLQLLFEDHFTKKTTFDDRFDRIINELRLDRIEQRKKWEEQNKKWEEWNLKHEKDREQDKKKWEEQNKKWEEWNLKHEKDREQDKKKWEEWNIRYEQNRLQEREKWEEQNKKWEEWNLKHEKDREQDKKKWEEWNIRYEQNRIQERKKWEEQNKKWEEQHKYNLRLLENIDEQDKLHRSSIGALGARWGLHSEESFRNGLKGILEKDFGVQIFNYNDRDDEGIVYYGRPELIELDIIVKNGILILCEIKSSLSKNDIYAFERKVRFYEKKHKEKATKLIVISPMVDPKAKKVADELGIKVYSHAGKHYNNILEDIE